jgi:hypothetical protein
LRRAIARWWETALGLLLTLAFAAATVAVAISINLVVVGLLAVVAEVALALKWSWSRRRRLAHGVVAATALLAALGLLTFAVLLAGGFGVGHD